MTCATPPNSAISATELDEVLGGTEERVEEEAGGEGAGASFGLEQHRRDFIARNMESIDFNGKRLKLFVDPAGRDGILTSHRPANHVLGRNHSPHARILTVIDVVAQRKEVALGHHHR